MRVTSVSSGFPKHLIVPSALLSKERSTCEWAKGAGNDRSQCVRECVASFAPFEAAYNEVMASLTVGGLDRRTHQK